MTDTFGTSARRLAALAAQTLGWRPHEFWASTPAELTTSLGLTTAEAPATLDRDHLQRMMERDQ